MGGVIGVIRDDRVCSGSRESLRWRAAVKDDEYLMAGYPCHRRPRAVAQDDLDSRIPRESGPIVVRARTEHRNGRCALHSRALHFGHGDEVRIRSAWCTSAHGRDIELRPCVGDTGSTCWERSERLSGERPDLVDEGSHRTT